MIGTVFEPDRGHWFFRTEVLENTGVKTMLKIDCIYRISAFRRDLMPKIKNKIGASRSRRRRRRIISHYMINCTLFKTSGTSHITVNDESYKFF